MSDAPLSRRAWLAGALLAASSAASAAASVVATPAFDDGSTAPLDREQSQRFRDWMVLLIHAQIERGPTPRWTHRDCAGLVRFAVAEALREHDTAWKKASGLLGVRVPADVDRSLALPMRHAWRLADGTRSAYVGALELVQQNTRLATRQLAQAQAGDLLLYDMGDEQHLMVWMGRYIAYHTGHVEAGDNGLRALRPAQLLAWNDTRWRPVADNPNFSGIYRLAFLAG